MSLFRSLSIQDKSNLGSLLHILDYIIVSKLIKNIDSELLVMLHITV